MQYTERVGLLDLPLELRQHIYKYAVDYSPEDSPVGSRSSMLLVSKAFSTEVIDVAARERHHGIVISHKGARFDSLSRAAARHSGGVKDLVSLYSTMRHLVVDVYAPPPGCRAASLLIMKRLQKMCKALAKIPRIQALCVRFCEAQDSKWIIAGHAINMLPMFDEKGEEISDIENCVTLLATLRNVGDAKILFPCSRPRQGICQGASQVEKSMMGIDPLDEATLDDMLEELDGEINHGPGGANPNVCLEYIDIWMLLRLRKKRSTWDYGTDAKREARIVRWMTREWGGREDLQVLRERGIWPGY